MVSSLWVSVSVIKLLLLISLRISGSQSCHILAFLQQRQQLVTDTLCWKIQSKTFLHRAPLIQFPCLFTSTVSCKCCYMSFSLSIKQSVEPNRLSVDWIEFKVNNAVFEHHCMVRFSDIETLSQRVHVKSIFGVVLQETSELWTSILLGFTCFTGIP